MEILLKKTAINAGQLKYDDLIKNINRIYEATPWYDKLLMGVKNINDMIKFYDEIIKGNYGTVLTELSFELENPFRGFILTLKESNSAIFIANLVVLPEYRKQGLGTLLVKKSFE
ncbi:GNAT family N-acetyltransferase [Thermosipho sp. 1244]|uniref:GNAT family N-acetyltransferase n=1 Tax=Thermosipho sp. 1244 TaxID=1755816 RepID=UPI000985A075|nr:GNAT family N-acetyltransferase [Thermosipho sp. 1244]MBT1247871.1 hypothetical protein [Thermosipho sp. 1244]OOC45435.1 hypothetical protein XO09_08635 [Thermosipho sp. 1223]